MTGLTGST
ncbi:unnamed protein product [Lactuca saligna]|uniref:Uncharacterized protein n=1 Tax=Lactuca saligna TaxID=75948 RepID=A0AA36A3P8_LACSI|nr:unnamed protein product [Lactuca saligna]